MNKKEIVLKLQTEFKLHKKYFKPYDFTIDHNGHIFYIKYLSITKDHLITINNANLWEIKYGTSNGNRFQTKSTKLLDLSLLRSHKNVIIILSNKPHKFLRYINESEVEDVLKTKVNNNIVTTKLNEVIEYIKSE